MSLEEDSEDFLKVCSGKKRTEGGQHQGDIYLDVLKTGIEETLKKVWYLPEDFQLSSCQLFRMRVSGEDAN